MWIQVLLVRHFDAIICWQSQNLRESVIDLTHLPYPPLPAFLDISAPDQVDSRWRYHLLWSRFVLCTKCYERLTWFEKAKKNVEGIKGRSAVFISPLKTIKRKVKQQTADQLVVLVENVKHAPEQIIYYNNKASFNCKIFKVYRHVG